MTTEHSGFHLQASSPASSIYDGATRGPKPLHHDGAASGPKPLKPSASCELPLTKVRRPALRRVLSFDEEDMSTNENASAGGTAVRDLPIDWEALEDAFE